MGQAVTLPPPKVCLRIRKVLAMIGASAGEAEAARQKLLKLLYEYGCNFNDLPDILAASGVGAPADANTTTNRASQPSDDESVEAEAARSEAWETCSELARSENILAEFDRALDSVGLVGERGNAKLLYLAITSRLLNRPASVIVKGSSSGGKSFIVESVLRFFPKNAFYALTAMSERSLAYSTEPLKHRMLVISEAPGIGSPIASYLLRTLLSESRVRYETGGTLLSVRVPLG
jgi:hypothetical protein